jgi:hypothetical protein
MMVVSFYKAIPSPARPTSVGELFKKMTYRYSFVSQQQISKTKRALSGAHSMAKK